MIYNATNLIAACFDEHDVKYRIEEVGDASIVEAAFGVDAGPQVVARFISRDNDNDVAVRVFGLVCKVPEERRTAVLEACNRLSGDIRFFKFYLNEEDNVNVEADLPMRTDDGCVGECCFELFIRLMKILDDNFQVIAQALYSGTVESRDRHSDLFRLLDQLRDKPIEIVDGETG